MGLDRNIDITPQQRKTILSLLETFLPNTTAWVYGSRVKWTSKPNSDLDMVVFSTLKQVGKVSLLQEAFDESDLPFRVDLHVWDDVPEQFQKNIEAEHAVIVEAKEQLVGSKWKRVKIEDIAEVRSGKRLPKGEVLIEDVTPYPYIRLVDVSEGRIRKSKLQYLSLNIQEKIKRYIVNSGDVCLAIVGHTIGMVFFVDKDFDSVNLTENAARLTNFSNDFDSRYLYYYLISSEGQNDILSRTVGSAQGKLPLYNIRSLEVPQPSKAEQKTIAHILGSLDDKMELNRQMNATLEAMAQALFKSWFVDFDPVIDNALAAGNDIPETLQLKAAARQALSNQSGNDKRLPDDIRQQFPSAFEFSETMGWIPEGWEVEKLNKLLEVKYGKDHKKLKEGNIPVYGSGGLMRFADSSLYEGESILIPRKGTLSNLMYVDEEFWTVDTMFFSIPKLQNTAKYLFYCLISFDFVAMNVGSAVPSMTTKVLNDLNVLKPSETLLKVFDEYLVDLFKQKKSRKEETKTLTKLRDTLLPKLLSGELRIPDAETLVKEAL